MNLLNSSCCFRNLLKNQVKFSECPSSKSRNQSANGSEHLRSSETDLSNGETSPKCWCGPVAVNHHKRCNSARVLRSVQKQILRVASEHTLAQRESVCRSALGKLQPIQGHQHLQPTRGHQQAKSRAAVCQAL